MEHGLPDKQGRYNAALISKNRAIDSPLAAVVNEFAPHKKSVFPFGEQRHLFPGTAK
jgi:hypothetical protein